MKTTILISTLMMAMTAFAGPVSGGGAVLQFPTQPFAKACQVRIYQTYTVAKETYCHIGQEGEFVISYDGVQKPDNDRPRQITARQIDSKLKVTDIPEAGECHLIRPLPLESFLNMSLVGTYAFLDDEQASSGYDSLQIFIAPKDPTGKMRHQTMFKQELDLHQKALRIRYAAEASSKMSFTVDLRCKDN